MRECTLLGTIMLTFTTVFAVDPYNPMESLRVMAAYMKQDIPLKDHKVSFFTTVKASLSGRKAIGWLSKQACPAITTDSSSAVAHQYAKTENDAIYFCEDLLAAGIMASGTGFQVDLHVS